MTVYTTGTVTLVNGSKTVSGDGTGWQVALIASGVIHVQVEGGNALPFDTVVSNTEITAAIEWAGASGSYAYALVIETKDGRQTIANTVALSEYIQRLQNAGIAAVAGVTPEADTLLLFTGGSSATTISRSDLLQGVAYDESVDDLAGLAIYDAETKGFSVFVGNAGDDRAAIYIKRSDDAGDWLGPAYITPEKGDKGNPGEYTAITFEPVETLPPGSAATQTVTSTGPGAISIKLGVPAGVPGDIAGPASSTAGGRPAFADTSGKNLIEEPITALEAVFDNSVAGLKDNPATVQAAIEVLATSPSGGANDALFALEIADLKGGRLGMKGGIADPFDDETGVNASSSSGQTYNATDDHYSPTVTAGASQIPTMTAATTAGVTMSDNGNSGSGFEAWRAADANQGTGWSQNPFVTNNFLKVDFGAGNTPAIASYSLICGTNNYPVSFKLQGSSDNSAWTDLDSRTGQAWTVVGDTKTYAVASPAAYRYYRLLLLTGGGGTAISIYHMIMNVAGSVADMELVSVPYSAVAMPSSARMAIQVSGAQSFIVNTDLIGEVSRNGGGNWSVAALSETTSLSGIRMYEADEIDISGQPVASDVCWRIRTANGKVIQVSGVVLQWKD